MIGSVQPPAIGGAPLAGEQLPLACDSLEAALRARIGASAIRWLEQARGAVRRDPGAIATIFPAVARAVGRAPLDPAARAEDLHAWSIDDAARTLLLADLGSAAGGQLPLLYRHGDAAERRAVLRALAHLHVDDATGVGLVEDALRTNDLRLIAASLGPYAFATLDDAALAQAVLKCVFLGVPIAALDGLDRRLSAEMASMLARYAHERVAAGRTVPQEIWPPIDRFPPVPELAAIEAELRHPQPTRRAAARRALAGRALSRAGAEI